MDILDTIKEKYRGMIQTAAPASIDAIHTAEAQLGLRFPAELVNLLLLSDGMKETMLLQGSIEPIGSILYSLEEITALSRFYMRTYGINGVVFSDDGAGDVYYIRKNEEIWYYHPICGEEEAVSDSLTDFFKILL